MPAPLRKTWLGALGALTVGTLLALVLLDPHAAPPGRVRPAPVAAETAPSDHSSLVVPSAVSSAKPTGEGMALLSALEHLRASGSSPWSPSRARTVRVRAVEAAGGAAVRDARIWAAAPRWDAASTQARPELLGAPVRTGADGTVVLSLPAPATAIVARADGLYGERAAPPLTREAGEVLVVRLEPDWDLVLSCVDPSGAAVPGLRLALRLIPGDADDAALSEAGHRRPLGRTDGEGRLALPHAQRRLRLADRPARARVFVDAPGCEHVGALLDPAAPPTEPVELVVPAGGPLVARVRDAAGRARPGVLVAIEPEPAAGEEPRRTPSARVPTDVEGVARFPRVAVGGRYLVAASTGGASAKALVPGPLGPERAAVAELFLDEAPIVLEGRVLDADGSPLAGEPLRLAGSALGTPALRRRTDAEGRFAFDLPASAAGLDLAQVELVRLPEGGVSAERAALPALVLEPGRNPVGDVRFGTTPLLLAGRVLGAAEDLHDVRLVVETRDEDGEWTVLPDVAVFPRGGGAFELRAPRTGGPLRLRAEAPRHLPAAPVPFRFGDRDARLALHPGGSLAATFRLERDARARLEPVRAPERPDPLPVFELDAGGPFRRSWHGLRAGTYDLVVEERASGYELLVIREVLVEPGRPCEDPRLELVEVR